MATFPTTGQRPYGALLKAYIDQGDEDIATPGGSPVTSIRRSTPAAEWSIVHNLGGYPVPVILLDDNPDHPVTTDVTYVDTNTLVLTFPSPVTGWVHLN